MKEETIIDKKLDDLKMPRKLWQSSQNLILPKARFKKLIFHAKTTSSNKYKDQFAKLEQQYSDIQAALSRRNSVINEMLNKNLKLASKVNTNKYKLSNFLIFKCLMASGIVYGTIYAGIWSSQTDCDRIIDRVSNKNLDETKSDIITAYNNAIKYLGVQAQNLPDNFFIETKKMCLDYYEQLKKIFRLK